MAILSEAPSVRVLRLPEFPTPKDAAGGDEVLVGRIRKDEGTANGLASSSRATTSERERR